MTGDHPETFRRDQVICAIDQFLEYGEQEYNKSHKGYFSGPGWAARALRWHLEQLKLQESATQQPGGTT